MTIFTTPLMDKAVAFCWEYQRGISRARQSRWDARRLKNWVHAQEQLWRRFPAGIRQSAHNIFKDQLNEQLRKPTGERDSTKPVFLNELYDIKP